MSTLNGVARQLAMSPRQPHYRLIKLQIKA